VLLLHVLYIDIKVLFLKMPEHHLRMKITFLPYISTVNC